MGDLLLRTRGPPSDDDDDEVEDEGCEGDGLLAAPGRDCCFEVVATTFFSLP